MHGNFVAVDSNSYFIAAIFEEVMEHYSQRKIIGLDQRLLKLPVINSLTSQGID